MNSYPGEGNGTPLQYSCLENPMDGGAWWAAVHGVAKSRTRMSNFTFTFHFHALEKEMATHSVFLPGESQGRGSLVGCHLWGLTESDTTEATQQQQQQQLISSTGIITTTLISWHLTFSPLFCFTCWISSNILESVHSEVSTLSCQACLGFCCEVP